MKKLFSNLTFQVITAIIIGVIVGISFPSFSATAKLISATFINLIG